MDWLKLINILSQHSDGDEKTSSANNETSPASSDSKKLKHAKNENFEYQMNTYFKCSVCDKLISSNEKSMDTHMRFHKKDKWRTCETCGRKFSSTTGLQRHSLTHTDEKPFRCEFCGRGFRWKSSYKNHRHSHYVKNYRCQFCKETFTTSEKLITHKELHKEKNDYKRDEEIKEHSKAHENS